MSPSRGQQQQQQQGGGHRCGICGDLRDRHKRRCIHTFAQPKRSRQRSCRACAVSKLGCDQEQPSCHRCLTRNIPCEYVRDVGEGSANVVAERGPGPSTAESAEGQNTDSSAPETDAMAQPLTTLEGGDYGSLVEMDGLAAENTDRLTTPNEPMTVAAEGRLFRNTASPQEHDQVQDLAGSTFPYPAAMEDVVPDKGQRPARSRPQGLTTSHQVIPNWSPGLAHGGNGVFPFPNVMAGDGPSSSGQLLGESYGVNSTGNATMYWLGDQQLHDSDGIFATLPTNGMQGASISGARHVSETPPASSGNRTAESASLHNGESALGSDAAHGDHAQGPQRRNDVQVDTSPEEMVNTIMSYLPMMVARKPPAPPFVHDQIYRCTDGDVKEAIARAMVCINAHTGVMPSGRSFVQELINKERDRLINAFPHCIVQTDMLAALHAMCVYQALGLFGESVEQTRDGELHQPYLLKIARRVAQKYRKDLTRDFDAAPSGWTHWCFIETLRRTLFLAHIINVLSARLQKRSSFFYEALDDDLVQNMPLPAASALWEASSEAHWRAARANTSCTSRMGGAVRRDDGGGDDADGFTRTILAVFAMERSMGL